MPAIRTIEQYRQLTINAFKEAFPEEEIYSPVFAKWLLTVYCTLLERYALYQEFHSDCAPSPHQRALKGL